MGRHVAPCGLRGRVARLRACRRPTLADTVAVRPTACLGDDACEGIGHTSDLSGRWLEQDFCADCGSNIGLRLEAVPDVRSLAIGSFDDRDWLDAPDLLVRHVFTRSRLGISDIPNDVEAHELHFRV